MTQNIMRHWKLTCLLTLIALGIILYSNTFHTSNKRQNTQSGTANNFSHTEAGRDATLKVRSRQRLDQTRTTESTFALLAQAIGAVKDRLKIDEASRTKLVAEHESDLYYTYQFETLPRADMDQFISDICLEIAESKSVNPVALKTQVFDTSNDFRLPDGMRKHIEIAVPKEPDENILFIARFTASEHIDNKSRNPQLISTSETITDRNKPWRYDKLLDLTTDN